MNNTDGGDGGMWLRSSYCEAGACVQARRTEPGTVLVRDGKDPDGPVLSFDPGAWTAFVAALKDGSVAP